MLHHTSKLSVIITLTLSLAGTNACVVAEESAADGAGSAEAVDLDEAAATGRASIRMGDDGKLVYVRDSRGDTVPDFSNAGYQGGGVAIPRVPVVRTLTARSGDNRAAIQAAIDEVSRLPRAQRGAILLRRGTYRLSGPLTIRASGVVLRGEGDGAEGTVLLSTSREQITLIQVQGSAARYGDSVRVTDDYVPVGSRSVTLESTRGLAAGDTISVIRPSTRAWIRDIGMDRIPPRSDGRPIRQWAPGDFDLESDRVITGIDGRRVTFDAPLTNSLEEKYGRGTVRKATEDNRISEVGVENLRGVALERVRDREDENHAENFIALSNVKNAWVQGVTGTHFIHAVVSVGDGAKWVTVRRSKSLEPIGQRTGGRFYAFENDGGQLTLFHECASEDGRHDFVLGSRVPGPNVFLESSRTSNRDTSDDNELGPHQRWSTGVLFDSMDIEGGNLSAYDRGNAGSGHGWTGANLVFWNNTASDGFRCERPPAAHQWIFGSTGEARTIRRRDMPCEIESANRRLAPRSLYRAQLAERLGARAVEALDAR